MAVAMVDGQGLGRHLRAGPLTARPVEVRPDLLALTVAPSVALDEYLRLRLHVPRLAPLSRAFGALAETVPGIRDLVVMGKVVYEASRPDWDLVIADGPPTGQVLSYLRAPAALEGLVPGGRVLEQARWMRRLLEDPDTSGLVVVATPEQSAVAEARETMEAVAAESMASLASVVANRVLPAPGFGGADAEAEAPGPRRQAALLHLHLFDAQSVELASLEVDVRLPMLFGMRTPGEVASRLADSWGDL